MQDLQADKKESIHEIDTNVLIETIFNQNGNGVYKADFCKQLGVDFNLKIKEHEETTEKISYDKLKYKKALTEELTNSCNNLYYNTLISSTGVINIVKLTEDWKESQCFKAILCIRFLQYIQHEINDLTNITANKKTNGLNERQSIILLRYLYDVNIFRPEKVSPDQTKQALLINAIRGGTNKITGSNCYKYWNEIGDKKHKNEYYNTINLKAILKYLQPIENNELIVKITKDLNEAESRKINGLGT
jgi:hypothetical protein